MKVLYLVAFGARLVWASWNLHGWSLQDRPEDRKQSIHEAPAPAPPAEPAPKRPPPSAGHGQNPERRLRPQDDRPPNPERPRLPRRAEGPGMPGPEKRQPPRPGPPPRPSPSPKATPPERPLRWQDHRAQNFKAQQRTWEARGGYRGYRIPPARFQGAFGREHGFRFHDTPVYLSQGRPQFHAGGFWFTILDPWPETWSETWYEEDELYIDFDGQGYYLMSPRYPGDRITLSVTLR
jgi:hypothetical protein